MCSLIHHLGCQREYISTTNDGAAIYAIGVKNQFLYSAAFSVL